MLQNAATQALIAQIPEEDRHAASAEEAEMKAEQAPHPKAPLAKPKPKPNPIGSPEGVGGVGGTGGGGGGAGRAQRVLGLHKQSTRKTARNLGQQYSSIAKAGRTGDCMDGCAADHSAGCGTRLYY